MGNKKRITKRSLISSVISLVLCISMLIGTTFAWFTDSVTSGKNRIQAGNLDVELYHSATGTPDRKVESDTELFQVSLWEPGVVVNENFAIKNEGTLALKYVLDFNLANIVKNYVVEKNGDTAVGTSRTLEDVLYVKIINGTMTDSRPVYTSSDGIKLADFLSNTDSINSGALEAGATKNIAVTIYWPESNNDNNYNLKNGWYASSTANDVTDDNVNALYIELPISLVATQYTSESDSFGQDYDKYPGTQPPYTKPVTTSSASVDSSMITELNTDKGSVIIPENAGLAEDTVAHLEITETDEANGELVVTDDHTVISYEVELVDQNGDPIDLTDQDGKTLQARVEVGFGLDVNRIKVYRDGTTELNVVKYENGFVYFESDHFCDVDVVLQETVARIGNTYYYSYDEAADNVAAGAVIDGVKDVDAMALAIENKYGTKYVITKGEHQVTVSASVAVIGTTTFDSVAAAIEMAENDAIITLIDDAVSEGLIVKKNLTIELNGKTLNINAKDGFMVKNAKLTLQDSSAEQTGTVNHVGRYDLADVSESGTLAITSGTYTTTGSYGCLYIGSKGKSEITGGRFNKSVTCAKGYDAIKEGDWYVVQPVYYWSDCASEDYASIDTDAKVIEIATAEQLAKLASDVNSGTDYYGYTINLTQDINLEGKRWTPIGTSGKPFRGKFNGNNHTISNLDIPLSSSSDVGLFGFTKDGSVSNLSIHNASVQGYLDVGVVAGTPYTSSYSDITVTGNIRVDGYAYVGGMFGKNLYANATNLVLEADGDSYVKADSQYYRTYVGGIVGFMGEGRQVVSNVRSNIDVYGSTCDVGGITGIAHYHNSFINCSSSGNVYITSYNDEGDQLEIGGIAGVWHNETGTTVTFTDCSFTGTVSAMNSNGTVYSGEFEHNGFIGRKYGPGTGKLIIDGVEYTQ